MKDVTVVLAHGAWADGSSWARVVTALKAEGTTVAAAPLPLTSLVDDVAALNRSLDRIEGPIVLVGHAYAGAVIALARPERVKALVYVTALAPDEGEKSATTVQRRPTRGTVTAGHGAVLTSRQWKPHYVRRSLSAGRVKFQRAVSETRSCTL